MPSAATSRVIPFPHGPEKKSRKQRTKERHLSANEVLAQIMNRSKSHAHYKANPCLMRKIDVQTGIKMKNIGRQQDGSIWTVTRIRTDLGPGYGMKTINEVIRLDDLVTLVNEETREMRTYRFSHLEYSAVWWLA